jgi:hypothetical protein
MTYSSQQIFTVPPNGKTTPSAASFCLYYLDNQGYAVMAENDNEQSLG